MNKNCSCPTFPLRLVLLWLAVLLADITLPVLTLRYSCPQLEAPEARRRGFSISNESEEWKD